MTPVIPTVLTQAEEMQVYPEFYERKKSEFCGDNKIFPRSYNSQWHYPAYVEQDKEREKKHKRITNSKGTGKYKVNIILCVSVILFLFYG